MKRAGGPPSPVLVLALTGAWLLLNQTLAPGHVLLGLVLGLALAWSGTALRPLQARLRRIDAAAVLVLVVLADIVRSNIAVGRLVLGLAARQETRSGFLEIPLELRAPHGLAALAVIVSSIPGTVWVGLSPAGDKLTLHVLDLLDESEWIALIKERYERPLLRIFE
jgi:multicomponent K+:H+ antiporter subunit E